MSAASVRTRQPFQDPAPRRYSQLDSARRNWWFNAAHDRVNFAIKEAKVAVDVEQNPAHRKPTGEIVLKMTTTEEAAASISNT